MSENNATSDTHQADSPSANTKQLGKKKIREIFAMLAVGTSLEYLDVALYIHMAVVIDKVFFPAKYSHIWFFSNLTILSTFIFKPFGAIFLGKVADIMGRKFTVYITTTSTAVICFITACLPSYNTIGITSAYILTLCRVIQGITSTGELKGAELYMMESVRDSRTQCIYSALLCFCADIGKFFAIGIASFSIFLMKFYQESWRIAFIAGSVVGLIGSYSRTCLKESTEFADAKKAFLIKNSHPVVNTPINKKAYTYFFFIRVSHMWLNTLIPLFYCKEYMVKMGLSPREIINQNTVVTLVMTCSTFFTMLLILAFRPVKISLFKHWISLAVVIIAPFWLTFVMPNKLGIFIMQLAAVCFTTSDFPAGPVFYKRFTIFKRATTILFSVSISGTITALVWMWPTQLLMKHLGHFALYIVLLPCVVISLIGKYYFKNIHDIEDSYQ